MIGVFGGTFDPIHLGHLRAAWILKETLSLKEIRFIPCKEPTHKRNAIAHSQHRFSMLALAIENQPGFIADDREIKRSTPSFMIETLRDLQKDCQDETLGLIIGSDSLQEFTSWRAWEDILQIARLIVISRPQETADIAILPEIIRISLNLQCLPGLLPLSSTMIREEIKAGRSVRFLVPMRVLDYIQQNKLYR